MSTVLDVTHLCDIDAARYLSRACERVFIPPMLRTAAAPWEHDNAIKTFLDKGIAPKIFLSEEDAGRLEIADKKIALISDLTALLSADLPQSLTSLFQECVTGFKGQAELLRLLGTPHFSINSMEMYGAPNAQIRGTDKTYVDVAQTVLQMIGPPKVTQNKNDELIYNAQEFIALLCEEVNRSIINIKADWTTGSLIQNGKEIAEIALTDQMSARVSVTGKKVKINPNARFSFNDAIRLAAHEIGVHIGTNANGSRQPHLAVAGKSLPHTSAMQEGMAVLSELLSLNDPAHITLRRICVRVVAAEMAYKKYPPMEVYQFINSHHQDEQMARSETLRVYRGTDGDGPFTKDCAYLLGVVDLLLKLKNSENPDTYMQNAMAGKFSASQMSHVENLIKQGIINAADDTSSIRPLCYKDLDLDRLRNTPLWLALCL